MTYSIVARDPDTGAYGVAGFTSIVGYGFLVPQASLRGAAATQAFVNTNMAYSVMQLAHSGVDAAAAAEQIVEHDFDKNRRQLLAVGQSGRPFGWSGQEALAYCGHVTGDGYVAGGNTLVGHEVVEAMGAEYEKLRGEEFGLRLIRAVQAGKQAGGERSDFKAAGVAFSSALLIAAPKPRFWHNLRVDSTQGDAAAELEGLYDAARHEGELMDQFYAGTDVVIRPFHWRWIRDLTGQKDPPDA